VIEVQKPSQNSTCSLSEELGIVRFCTGRLARCEGAEAKNGVAVGQRLTDTVTAFNRHST